MVEKVFELAHAGKLKEAAALCRKLIDEKQDLKGLSINLAHLLTLSGDWAYINALLPENTNTLSSSGWLNSVANGRPVNQSDEPIPWFTYPAIDFLDDFVQPTWKVFEWGSGNSTLWWAKRVSSVVSVEDNEEWVSEIEDQMPPNVEIKFLKDQAYSKAVLEVEEHSLDAIVIDGSHRNQCTEHAIRAVKEEGLIIFDNSDRSDYDSSYAQLSNAGFYRIDFWGQIPSFLYKNCTSIYFNDLKFLKQKKAPHAHQSSVGSSCAQAM